MFFYKEPEEFTPSMHVVICYCIYNNETLFLRRKENKFQGCLWTAPGGKVEYNELLDDAIKREVDEETGMDIPKENFIQNGTYYIRHPHIDFMIYIYKTFLKEKPKQITLSNNEHDKYMWVTPKSALNLELIPEGDQCLFATFSDISLK